nr:uncharacterized protein LOC126534168 [Dermacentor andersoni]XP_054928704.1 uncharacterized protein LOC126534168 [Dermacentor andersoni]XP_054928705.1 uncharacterized protein LOC126534168 [Dermacentor andersoni]
MAFHAKMVSSAVLALAILGVIEASSQGSSQKDLPEYCSKGGEIDWMAVLSKAFELYQNYASKQAASPARSPLEDILAAAVLQKSDSAVPGEESGATGKPDAKESAGTPQPDVTAALLSSLLSNLGNADGSSKKSAEADPMAGLKTVLDGLNALNGKGSSSGSAGAIDLSKLAPLILQGLPTLLGTQGSGSQTSVLSLLGSLLGNQQTGKGLEKMFSQVLNTIFNPDRKGKDGGVADGLEPAISNVIESLLKAGFKDDASTNDVPKDTEKSTLRSEL